MKLFVGCLGFLCVVLGFVFFFALDFGISALIMKGICWAFGLTFSWKYVFGIWLVMVLLQSVFASKVTVNNYHRRWN